jgi:putative transposase
MHGINQSYAQYYNLKYGRHGHLFQDKFKSKLIQDEGYLMSVSGYIHNNPNHMSKYEGCMEDYPYSSLGIYLGMRKDKWEMADTSMILPSCGRNMKHAREQYLEFVKNCDDIDNLPEFEFKNEVKDTRAKRALSPGEKARDRRIC